MIKSVMLVLLGFFAASLIAVTFAPAFWARAVRLTRERIRASLPVTEAEVRAEKDQLRAQYAVRVHQLQKALEEAKVRQARQTISINRRDSQLEILEQDFAKVSAELAEQSSARNVLEQTINERLPQTQGRLQTARQALGERDALIQSMQQDADRQMQAAHEFEALTKSLQTEVDHLKMTLSTRQDRQRRAMKNPAHETEAALRTEVDQLRAKTREQANLLETLQKRIMVARAASGGADADTSHDWELLQQQFTEQNAQLDAAKRELAAFKVAASARGEEDAGPSFIGAPSLGERYQALSNICDDQKLQIREMEAQLTSLRQQLEGKQGNSADTARETRADLKSRIKGIEGKSQAQNEVISGLRAELAAANEKVMQQAASHRQDLNGAGKSGSEKLAPAVPASQTEPSAPPKVSSVKDSPQLATVDGDIIEPAAKAGKKPKARFPKPTLREPAERAVKKRGLSAIARLGKRAATDDADQKSEPHFDEPTGAPEKVATSSEEVQSTPAAQEPVTENTAIERAASGNGDASGAMSTPNDVTSRSASVPPVDSNPPIERSRKKSAPPSPFGARPRSKKSKKIGSQTAYANGDQENGAVPNGNGSDKHAAPEPTPPAAARAKTKKGLKLLDRIRSGADK